jgi:hypothetical protein
MSSALVAACTSLPKEPRIRERKKPMMERKTPPMEQTTMKARERR